MSRQNSTFRFRGRRYRVQGRITVRHRTYGLLQLLSRRGSASIVRDDCDRGCEERWLVSELGQKTLRELRSLQVLPERLSRQKLRVLQQLTDANPFAAAIIDCERRDHMTLIVSQWIPGESLSEWLGRQTGSRRVSLHEALRLYRGLVRALSGFHRTTGLVHGDVHPDNFVIGSRSKWLIPIDYGSAWHALDAMSQRQTQGFRALWAAPEINLGKIGDQRSDQFSATLLLFVMLTGELPFDRLGGRAACFANPDSEPFWERPTDVILCYHSISHSATGSLSRFLDQVLAADPQERFATDAAWMSATEQLFRQLTESSRKGSLFDRLLKMLRTLRNRGRDISSIE